MKSELIVDAQPAEVSIALLEDGRLVSLQKEARNIAYAVGDIYLAKVKKLMPGLNAAFINVGYEKDAFLHYLDLGPHFAAYSAYLKQIFADRKKLPKLSLQKQLPDIDKHGSVADQLTAGQELLVQIVKEPISSKGPRLTTELSFTGRYLVLTPFADKISISQKIKSTEEKLRLRQLVESIKPKNFGVIIRTSAEGKKVAELNHELKTLVQAFEDTCAKAQRSQAPELVFEEQNRVVGVLRDIFNPSFENIHINDRHIYDQILKYVNLIAPDRREIVKLYDKDMPIFDCFSVTRQIKSSFGKTVSFKSGAYIIIETTEALHVIDVNSGNRSKATNDQETNALEVNLRAADEIARQLRLRDMGGIIVVDFIDMAKAEHRQQLFDHMREIMANDRARHNILPLSKFGLMQITRQRVRPALDVQVSEQCPSCNGKGEVQASILFTDTLYEKLEYLINTLDKRDFIMYVHPYVDAYIKKGLFRTMYGNWRRALGRCFRILPDESVAYLEYRVVDKDHNEIVVREEKDDGHSSATKAAGKTSRGEEQSDEPAKNEQPKAKPQPKPQPKPKPQPRQQDDRQSEQSDQPKNQPKEERKEERKPQTPRAKKPAVTATDKEEKAPLAIPESFDTPAADEPSENTSVVPEAISADSVLAPEKAEQKAGSDINATAQHPEPESENADSEEIFAESDADDEDDAAEETTDDTATASDPAKPKKRRRRRRKPKQAPAEPAADETQQE